MGSRCPSPKGGGPPIFSAHVYSGQMAGCIKMPLGTKIGLSPLPNFRPISTVAKRLNGSKMALSMEVGLGPVHIVLDGDTAPLPTKRGQSPRFSAHLYCGQTAGCIKMPHHGMKVGLSPGNFVLDGDPALYPKMGGAPPNFRPTSILWPNGCMDQDAALYGSRPRPRPHCPPVSTPQLKLTAAYVY